MNAGKTVMVVDDDEALRESICELLEDEGYQALGMARGAAALDRLRADGQKPNLILLDLMMPGMNGWDFRKEQLQDPSLAAIPVVVMTASRELRGITADEVVFKPVKREALLRAVKQTAGEEPKPAAVGRSVETAEALKGPEPKGVALGDEEEQPTEVLRGGGAMGTLMRSVDWACTPLGPLDTWSTSLRTLVSAVLQNRFPMQLWWTRDLVVVYNDAYQPMLGEKHPRAMGSFARDVWAEIWEVIGPQAQSVLDGGPATWNEHLLLILQRRGFLEETYWTFSYSPARNDGGEVAGILVTVQETTDQVHGERQFKMLRDLGARAGEGKSGEQVCRSAAAVLATHDIDIPFVLLYLNRPDGTGAELVASAGMGDYEGPAKPAILTKESKGWPIAALGELGPPLVVSDLASRFGALPIGRWKRTPRQAVMLSLVGAGQTQPYGYLVAGVSPMRQLDERYLRMFRQVGDQVSVSIGAARAFQEERRRAMALAELDRAKTIFFNNVSHEFRTPLTLMLGPTQDMLGGVHGVLEPEQREQLQLLHRNGLRLHKLVNALLDFSRLEAGRVQASYEPVDLSKLTCELAEAFKTAVDRAGLTLVIDCPELEEAIYVDRDMWENIVLNLLSNALKFTFEGRIEVSLHSVEGHVELKVKDTGVGIPAEELPRLFERFHRVEGARARTHEGSGIGLALVLEHAKLHGATVHAESRPGIETCFTVRVPKGTAHLPKDRVGLLRTPSSTVLRVAPFVEEALRWLRSDRSSRAVPLSNEADAKESLGALHENVVRRGARILLAEDNADMRDYVCRHLEPYWNIEAVEDGTQALAAARAKPPDLILTDVMMPGLDGFSLLRELRQDARLRQVPVIMLSARAGEEAVLEGLHAGVEDYLTKPFSARELVARVRSHLQLAAARNEVRRQREHLYSLFMQAPIPICVVQGNELVFEMANQRYRELIGGRDVQGRAFFEVFPEMRGQGFDELLRGVMKTGEAFVGQEMLARLNLDGASEIKDNYFTFIYAPIRNEEGVVDRVMAVIHEVTEQVTARRRVEEEEEKFRRIVTQVQAGISQTDLSGRFTLTNERFREIVGRSAAELRQLRIQDTTHPDDLEAHKEQFQRLVEQGTPFVIEERYLKPDGSIVWVQNSVSRIDDRDGRPQGVASVTVDITRRKFAEQALRESEVRFRALADASPALIWRTDASGQAIYVNRRYAEFFGPAAEAVNAKGGLPRLHPDDAPGYLEAVLAAESTQAPLTAEVRVRNKRGEWRWVDVQALPVRGGNAEYQGHVGTCIDITDRKLAEAEKEARVVEMEQALNFSEKFVGILGHDLRNPLGAIVTASDLLLRRETSERIARPIQRIHTSAERMTRMIEQILDLTRARIGGGIPIKPTPVDLEPLATSLVEELEGAAPQKIVVESLGDLRGQWDPDRLAQVISNLLGNAVEHGDANQPVRLKLDGTDADTVRFSIWNAGAVPQGLLPSLFDPFRGSPTAGKATKSKGLGLGLYIVQQIIQGHGGSVEVRSTLSEGTTFFVCIPRLASSLDLPMLPANSVVPFSRSEAR